MRLIKTASGKEYPIVFCGVLQQSSINELYIKFVEGSLIELVTAFSDEDEVSVLYSYSEGALCNTYLGFTALTQAGVIDGKIYIKLEQRAQ